MLTRRTGTWTDWLAFAILAGVVVSAIVGLKRPAAPPHVAPIEYTVPSEFEPFDSVTFWPDPLPALSVGEVGTVVANIWRGGAIVHADTGRFVRWRR